MATTESRSGTPLPGDSDADVVVIGAGITGLSTALTLKDRGVDVTVIEADRVAAGVTGYTTAKITALHGLVYGTLIKRHGEQKARLYAEANLAAIEQIAERVDRLGIDCDFERMDAYTYTTEPTSIGSIEQEVDAATRAGLSVSLETETPLPFPVVAAIRVRNQAQFHPRRYCIALAAAIEGGGSHVFENTRVLDVSGDDRITVTTDRGVVRARSVVVATQMPIIHRGFFYAKAHPQRSYAMAARIGGAIPAGMFLSAESPVRSLRPYRDLLIIGGQSHRVGEGDDQEENYRRLEAWARETFDVRSIEHRWSAQDYMPADGVPYIGRASRSARNIFVATGFNKWGMTTGTFAGTILADLITGTQNPWLALFDATKLNPMESARDIVVENTNVAKHFVLDRVAGSRSLQDLAPGEGAIVRCEGRTVAAYRDDDGTVRAVSALCTHLGCRVRFNDAERSWDCPCHGSRFDTHGRVIQGPAVRDLEPKDVAEPAES